MSNFRHQQELEEERLRGELEALQELDKANLHYLAVYFAQELGITHEYNKEIR